MRCGERGRMAQASRGDGAKYSGRWEGVEGERALTTRVAVRRG